MTKKEEHSRTVFKSFEAFKPLYAEAKEQGNERVMKLYPRFLAFNIWDIKGKNLCTGYCSKEIYERISKGLENGETYSSIKKTPEHWNSRQSFCEDLFDMDYENDMDYETFMEEVSKGHSYHYVTAEQNMYLTTREVQNLRGHEKYKALGFQMGKFTLEKQGRKITKINWEPVTNDFLIKEFDS